MKIKNSNKINMNKKMMMNLLDYFKKLKKDNKVNKNKINKLKKIKK